MRPISKKVKEEVLSRKLICQRKAVFNDHNCQGRITIEHVWTNSGKQIDKAWAMILLCEYAHSVGKYQFIGILDKNKNRYISLLQATKKDLDEFPRIKWSTIRRYLEKKYGPIV